MRPEEKAPTTDIEVKQVFEELFGDNENNVLAVWGIYNCYRNQGHNVIDSYILTLEKVLEID